MHHFRSVLGRSIAWRAFLQGQNCNKTNKTLDNEVYVGLIIGVGYEARWGWVTLFTSLAFRHLSEPSSAERL